MVTCEPPPDVPNMPYSPDLPTYNYSDSITFACDEGYLYVSGDLTRSCNEHAQWTGVAPSCTSKLKWSCDVRKPVFNVSNQGCLSIFNYFDSIRFYCDEGYLYVSGDATRSCNKNAQWTGIAPNCTSKNWLSLLKRMYVLVS